MSNDRKAKAGVHQVSAEDDDYPLKVLWVEGEDAPEAVPRHAEATAVTLQLPTEWLNVIREFANRKRVSPEVLMARWIDERVRAEAKAWMAAHLDRYCKSST